MALHIVGGSFGLGGRVQVNVDQAVVQVLGNSSGTYRRGELASVVFELEQEKRWSWASVLVGLLIVTPLLMLVLSILGLILGLVITVFGSRYNLARHSATLTFTDGKAVVVTGSRQEINRLSVLPTVPI